MKSDLDVLMQARNIDAMLVLGAGDHNPTMVYLTGGAHLTQAELILKRGQPGVLFHASMERDEAAKAADRSGLLTKNIEEYHPQDLFKQAGGDALEATLLRYEKMLTELGLTHGRLVVYGQAEAGAAFALLSALSARLPGLEILGELSDPLMLTAMATKENDEIQRIRQMGQVTIAVVTQVAEFLTSHAVQDDVLVKADGRPLTIGEVKTRINLWLAERGGENPEGTIFAIGRDAGVPHSSGNAGDWLRLGQTIVFDIFPCEIGGGYFYDFTRTWCLGYAPDPALALYNDVLAVYRQVIGELRLGAACKGYQQRACELFEERGHPTVLNTPGTQSGYVHSLGHGVGLHIHERPAFGLNLSGENYLYANSVITIEPGLYYPERGLGMRLEDTFWVRPDGVMEILADYPMDLVLPMKK